MVQTGKTDNTAKLFDRVFGENKMWNRWFFREVNRPEMLRQITSHDDNTLQASLHLMDYTMAFEGNTIPVNYIFGAMTAPEYRGRGLMSGLMRDTLVESRERGDVFCCLVPAHRHLFFYYRKFGFSTVFYIDEERYTSIHRFNAVSGYEEVPADFELYDMLQRSNGGRILHSELQYRQLKEDLAMSGGGVKAVADCNKGDYAVAAYVTDGGELRVRQLLFTSPEAKESVLAAVRTNLPEMPVVIEAMPSENPVMPEARGMIRLLNPEKAFEALAVAHPDVKCLIRLTDPLIKENEGNYSISGGHCRKVKDNRRPDIDVDIRTMSLILFSDKKIGSVFDLPTSRAFMALMLD